MKLKNKRNKTNYSNQKGITLIALVITIVVLLILAGVSINAIFSENGIINKAKDAQNKMNQAQQNDLDTINGLDELINHYTEEKDGINFKSSLKKGIKINCVPTELSCRKEDESSFNSYCNIGAEQTNLSLVSGEIYAEDIALFKPTKKEDDGMVSDWIKATETDYFHSAFYLKGNWENGGDIYLSDIKFKNLNQDKPIASSIRIGIKVDKQFYGVFKISDEENKNKSNILPENHIIDSSKTDGTTKIYQPYSKENFVKYDVDTGEVTLKPESCRITNVMPTSNNQVKIDVYMWVEAGSENFGWNLNGEELTDVELVFAGISND